MDLGNPVPTVWPEVDFEKKEASGKYVCSICGYVYDPAEHDGIAFEELPDDWKCPRCNSPRANSIKHNTQDLATAEGDQPRVRPYGAMMLFENSF